MVVDVRFCGILPVVQCPCFGSSALRNRSVRRSSLVRPRTPPARPMIRDDRVVVERSPRHRDPSPNASIRWLKPGPSISFRTGRPPASPVGGRRVHWLSSSFGHGRAGRRARGAPRGRRPPSRWARVAGTGASWGTTACPTRQPGASASPGRTPARSRPAGPARRPDAERPPTVGRTASPSTMYRCDGTDTGPATAPRRSVGLFSGAGVRPVQPFEGLQAVVDHHLADTGGISTCSRRRSSMRRRSVADFGVVGGVGRPAVASSAERSAAYGVDLQRAARRTVLTGDRFGPE